MATAYTTLLGLALPVTGELQGTWGTTVNDAITSLLDTAVAGTTTLNTDADVTLSTTTGAANQARQAIILWTANGTITRNITAPAQSKAYIVINNSAGTQSIVIRGVGPTTGVTVAKGERVVVAWNGSDFVRVSAYGGTGEFTTVDTTNLEVTNIKAKDGTASATIADTTGALSVSAAFAANGNVTLGDASGDAVTVNGTSTFTAKPTVQLTSAATNTVTQAMRLDSQSSGTPAAGIGVGLEFAAETAAGNTEVGATLEAITTDVTAASEDFDLSVKLMINGAAAAEVARFKSTGLSLATGDTYQINNTDVLSATTLGSGVTGSSLTSVGTIGTGTWQGTVINSTYGGTGINNGGRTLTINTNSGTLAFGAASKTLTINNSLTLAGTDATTMTFPAASTTVAGLGTTQTFTGVNTFTPTARTSGVASYFTLTTPADTGQTASTESIGANFTAAIRTWATGALTLQRERVFAAPTYAFAGASTLTTAVNVDIAAPVAGTNATITNSYALRAAATQFTGTVNATGLTASQAIFTDANKNFVSNAITGTGNVVMSTSPSLTTPSLGAATATSINKVAITAPATSATLTIADGKTLTVNNSITLAGTDATTMTFPAASTTVAGLGTTQTFTGVNTFTPTARTSGVASYFTLTTPADTGQTASTESIGASFTAATRTWATGALTLQRERVFAAPTYAFAGASTLTTAVNVDIAAPVAGANATITNAYALRAAATQFTGAINATGLTASQAIFTDANKNFVSNAITGTGSVVMSASPTLTGTITAAAANFSGAVALNGNSTLGDAVGDTVTINGTTTFVNAAPTLTPLTASQAVFTNGSKTLVSNAITGTGNVVMSASPTLTGTITAAGATFSGAVTMSTATDNLALGTSQTSGTWTAGGAAQTGTLTLDQSTKAHTLNLGTGATENATTKAINIGTAGVSGSTTNLTYGSGVAGSTTTHIWNSGGTEGMRLNSTGLGVGTSSPGAKLDVSGSVNAVQARFGNVAGRGLEIGTSIISGTNDAGSVLNAKGATSGTMIFQTDSTERMRLDSSGNLGIGTSSPSVRLDVRSTSNYQAYFQGTDAAGAAGIRTLNSGGSAGVALFTYGPSYAGGSIASIGPNGAAVIQTGNAPMFVGTDVGISQPLYLGNNGTTRATIDSSGNLGIGTSSPGAKLEVASGKVLLSNTQSYAIKTSAGASCDVVTLTSGNVLQLGGGGATNSIEFWNQGLQRMTLDSSGNLGIGTSSPATKLHVNSGAAGYAITVAALVQTARTYQLGIDANNSLAFYDTTAAAQRLLLDSSGNLGLGVTPSAWTGSGGKNIEVGATGNALFGSTSLTAYTSNANFDSSWKYSRTGFASRYEQQDSNHRWFTAPSGTAGNAISFTQAMTLDASGNLGVGETSLTERITVRRDGTTSYCTIQAKNANSTATLNIGVGGSAVGNTALQNNGYVMNAGNSALVFGTNDTERARITSGGDLLVGTTSQPSFATSRLVVAYGTADYALALVNNNAVPYGMVIGYTGASPNNTGSAFFYCQDSGLTQRFSVRANGGVYNYSANDVNLSDRREKTNFAPAKSYLDTICAIPVQTFNYIDQNMEEDPGKTLGVVAQDVQAVAPELVMESNWGTKDDPKMRLSVYQTDLQYALMKCIQEQQELIKDLRARVAALESQP